MSASRVFPIGLSALADLGRGLGSVLFPAPCLVCAGALEHPLAGPLCPLCLTELPVLTAPFCLRCALPFAPSSAPGLCGPCRGRRSFRLARAHLVYEGASRICLHALKFGGRERLASILAEPACRRFLLDGELRGAEFVVPVPLSRRRRRARGFNQAERIARHVARLARLPFAARALRRDHRPPQAGLPARARRRNVHGAFRARLPSSFQGGRALLVDDVLTTGATAEAAARALLLAGARRVDVLTLARVS